MLVNILNICSDDELGEPEDEMTEETEGRNYSLDVVFLTNSSIFDISLPIVSLGSLFASYEHYSR